MWKLPYELMFDDSEPSLRDRLDEHPHVGPVDRILSANLLWTVVRLVGAIAALPLGYGATIIVYLVYLNFGQQSTWEGPLAGLLGSAFVVMLGVVWLGIGYALQLRQLRGALRRADERQRRGIAQQPQNLLDASASTGGRDSSMAISVRPD